MTVRFDDSLPILLRIVTEELGEVALSSGVVLRDAIGQLAFFSSSNLSIETSQLLSSKLRSGLGPYARTDRVIAGSTDFGVEELLQDKSAFHVRVDGHAFRLVDRRLVGADWLRAPSDTASPPPRFVFASLKGGVGRSTALSIAAADIASRGRRVLAIDLDMEAPGLGAMLLTEQTLPEFGLIDALVENGLGPLDNTFLADLVGPSPLAHRQGRIDIIPALGRRSLKNPADILAKIARAYVEDVREDGSVATMLDQIRALVDHFSISNQYDAILVDARAGLHETSAAALLGLGADVFLFGLNEPQTFYGYAALLAHLARFVRPNAPSPEWLERITMVQARALDASSYESFAEKCKTLFVKAGFGPAAGGAIAEVPLPAEPFRDVPWDDDVNDTELMVDDGLGPRPPLAILEDERFRLFQPMARRDLLSEKIYRASYGMFLDRICEAFPIEEAKS